ncbi:hypothetical protein NDA16_004514 [Ustilago loliicola]|nr:hypothetical protein NDA16_004514 [Ustilago loliicola]
MKLSTIAQLLTLTVTAVTATPLVKRLPQGSDPAFSTPKSVLDVGLTCKNGSPSSQTKPILLVPGTGTTGEQSFDSNWIPLSSNLGYSPCWVSSPPFMLNDSQVNAEYIVNAVNTLYAGSGNKKVPVLTWSQGGLATQWGLTFFPSVRSKVDRGLNQIVPTTNLYSATDEIVQPQITNSPPDSSYLVNAKNIQAQTVCGPLFIIDHAGSLTSQFSYVVGKSALGSPTGQAQSEDYGLTDCSPLPANDLSAENKVQASGLLLVAGANVIAGPKQNCEPDLKPYARRYAIGKTTCSGIVTPF